MLCVVQGIAVHLKLGIMGKLIGNSKKGNLLTLFPLCSSWVGVELSDFHMMYHS